MLYFVSAEPIGTMQSPFEFDRSAIRKRRLSDPEPVTLEWVDASPARRLEALEFLRRNHSGEAYATRSIQKVHRITVTTL
jgi:hypothetical protein